MGLKILGILQMKNAIKLMAVIVTLGSQVLLKFWCISALRVL